MIGLLCNQTVSLKTDSKTLNGVQKLKYSLSILKHNKNVLTVAFSLACLEIRSRNKEAINSTTNTIYSLKVFYFLLYRSRYFLFVSELILNSISMHVSDNQKYLYGTRLYACMNTRKFKGLDSRFSLPKINCMLIIKTHLPTVREFTTTKHQNFAN